MLISIIIPVYQEEKTISPLIRYLQKNAMNLLAEIIVVDGGSMDDTVALAQQAGASTFLSPVKGRAAQMNIGAKQATGEILYFIHADVFPPATYATDICQAVDEGFDAGRYRTKFNSRKWYLRINEFFTRFDLFVCYGGDQTLFLTRLLFDQCGGFREEMKIMEEFEFTARLRQKGNYKIFKKGALVSDRKYDQNSWWKVQRANYTIVRMYKKGASQEAMVRTYREMLDYR